MKNFFIFLILSTLLTFSCKDHPINPVIPENNPVFFTNISIRFTKDIGTKTINLNENLVSDINIMVFNSAGQLISSKYSDSFSGTVEIEVWKGHGLKIFSVANIGKAISVSNIDEISDYKTVISSINDIIKSDGGSIMSGNLYVSNLSEGSVIYIPLKRAYARFDILLDKSQLDKNTHFEINTISVKNIPKELYLFKPNKPENVIDILKDGDHIGKLELGDIENNFVSLYTPENMQGALLTGNYLSQSKILTNHPCEQLCTYIEISGNYTSSDCYGTLTYRFYPGKNNYSNFDIERNCQYKITILPVGNGRNEVNWRVNEESLIDYVSSISLEPSNIFFDEIGQNKQITTTVFPVSVSSNPLIWDSSDENVATVDQNGMVTSMGDGICEIIASASDGGNCKSYCDIIVDTKIDVSDIKLNLYQYSNQSEITIINNKFTIDKDKIYYLIAEVLPENSTNKDVDWICSFNPGQGNQCITLEDQISGQLSVQLSKHVFAFRSISEGDFKVYVRNTASNITAECSITITPNILTITPLNIDLYKGESINLNYNYSPSDLSISFASSNPLIASVSSTGLVTAKSIGNCTIIISAGDITVDCKVSVKSGSVILSKKELTLYIGEEYNLSCSLLEPSHTSLEWNIISGGDNINISPLDNNKSCKITAVKEGVSTLKVSNIHGSTDECKITVRKPSGILSENIYNAFAGEVFSLYLSNIFPIGSNVNFKSSNSNIVILNSEVIVKPGDLYECSFFVKNAGECNIEAYVGNSSVASCKIISEMPKISSTTSTLCTYQGFYEYINLTITPAKAAMQLSLDISNTDNGYLSIVSANNSQIIVSGGDNFHLLNNSSTLTVGFSGINNSPKHLITYFNKKAITLNDNQIQLVAYANIIPESKKSEFPGKDHLFLNYDKHSRAVLNYSVSNSDILFNNNSGKLHFTNDHLMGKESLRLSTLGDDGKTYYSQEVSVTIHQLINIYESWNMDVILEDDGIDCLWSFAGSLISAKNHLTTFFVPEGSIPLPDPYDLYGITLFPIRNKSGWYTMGTDPPPLNGTTVSFSGSSYTYYYHNSKKIYVYVISTEFNNIYFDNGWGYIYGWR